MKNPKQRKGKIHTGDESLDGILNASDEALHEIVQDLADKMIEQERGRKV